MKKNPFVYIKLERCSQRSYKKKKSSTRAIRIINLSLNELKLIAKNRSIKSHKNKSEDDLRKILSRPKTKIRLSNKRIKDITEKLNESQYNFLNKSKQDQNKSL